MEVHAVLFWLFFAIAVAGGVFILLTRNIIYAAFTLMIIFLALAGIYILAGSEFVAITQILVYVGGILILLVFGVMLTNRIEGKRIVTRQSKRFWAVLIALLIIALFHQLFMASVEWPEMYQGEMNNTGNTEQLGIQLMTRKVLILEIAGVLLLISLIGSAFIARKDFGTAGSENVNSHHNDKH